MTNIDEYTIAIQNDHRNNNSEKKKMSPIIFKQGRQKFENTNF